MSTASHSADAHHGARRIRSREDAARFVEQFVALTGIRVVSVSSEGLPRAFLARAVPAPDRLVSEYGDELRARTRNALCRFDPGAGADRWTIRRLLQLRGFGIFSLLDLILSLC